MYVEARETRIYQGNTNYYTRSSFSDYPIQFQETTTYTTKRTGPGNVTETGYKFTYTTSFYQLSRPVTRTSTYTVMSAPNNRTWSDGYYPFTSTYQGTTDSQGITGVVIHTGGQLVGSTLTVRASSWGTTTPAFTVTTGTTYLTRESTSGYSGISSSSSESSGWE